MSEDGKSTTVTIKYGKGYEESWAVFRGYPADVRSQIVEYFGLDSEAVKDLSVHELVLNVTKIAHGSASVAAIGAVAIPAKDAGKSSDGPPFEPNVPAAEPEKPAEPEDPVIYKIKQAQSVGDIQKLWATNQDAFKRPEVQEAVKARRAEIGA